MDSYYELKYKDEEREIVYKVNIDINAEEMRYLLKDFLLGTSWHPETVDKILGEDL